MNIKSELTLSHVFSSFLYFVLLMRGRVCQTVHYSLLSAQFSLSVCLLRGQGGAVRESGMPWLFDKCQCAAPAITEAGFACVCVCVKESGEGLENMPSYWLSCPTRLTSRRLDMKNHTHSFRHQRIGIQRCSCVGKDGNFWDPGDNMSKYGASSMKSRKYWSNLTVYHP